MYYILIGLTAGSLYLIVGIALVTLWFRAAVRHGHNPDPDNMGFFVIFWPLMLTAVVVVLVVSGLGKIVARLGRTRARGEEDW
jgi:cell division protein FtsX